MVPIMNTAQRILNALQEGRVGAAIDLYNDGELTVLGSDGTKRGDLYIILTKKLALPLADADYWLDYFRVEPIKDSQDALNPGWAK